MKKLKKILTTICAVPLIAGISKISIDAKIIYNEHNVPTHLECKTIEALVEDLDTRLPA